MSGRSGSAGTSTAGSCASSTFSALENGDVDSIVLMRTIVLPRRFSSEPIACGEIGERRLVTERRAQLLARGFELAAHAAHAARPRVLAQRVDHRAANAPLGEGLELDAARIVEAVRGVDQSDHAVLDEIAEVDRMRHRRRHPPRQRLDKRQARFNAGVRCLGRTVSFMLPALRQRRCQSCITAGAAA